VRAAALVVESEPDTTTAAEDHVDLDPINGNGDGTGAAPETIADVPAEPEPPATNGDGEDV
jgi:hypothetical protein